MSDGPLARLSALEQQYLRSKILDLGTERERLSPRGKDLYAEIHRLVQSTYRIPGIDIGPGKKD